MPVENTSIFNSNLDHDYIYHILKSKNEKRHGPSSARI